MEKRLWFHPGAWKQIQCQTFPHSCRNVTFGHQSWIFVHANRYCNSVEFLQQILPLLWNCNKFAYPIYSKLVVELLNTNVWLIDEIANSNWRKNWVLLYKTRLDCTLCIQSTFMHTINFYAYNTLLCIHSNFW